MINDLNQKQKKIKKIKIQKIKIQKQKNKNKHSKHPFATFIFCILGPIFG